MVVQDGYNLGILSLSLGHGEGTQVFEKERDILDL